jgi:hypothetical protein
MENELLDFNLDERKHMFGESTYQHPLDDDAMTEKFLNSNP